MLLAASVARDASAAGKHARLSRPRQSCKLSRNQRERRHEQAVGTLRNESRAWVEVPADDNGDAMIAAMAEAGVDYIFFTSGSEIGFYQEAVAKAHAQGRKAPKLITVTHEHASLNAALGYAAVAGKPAVTAAHVDCGTQHYGGAVHTAFHCGLPVVITGGGSPTSYPGRIRGARDGGGHIWMQQSFDQNGIVRQYTKWDHRMELQDNVGLMISRALQVARTEPCGPVYLQLPREVSLAKRQRREIPDHGQLGVARPAAPDPDGIREIARRLVKAENPFVMVARSGRNPATVPALVRLCELLGLPVAQSGIRAYQCFPLNHPLYMSAAQPEGRRRAAGLDVDIPWFADTNPPPDSAWVAITDVEPAKRRIPTMEFTADLRLTADALVGDRGAGRRGCARSSRRRISAGSRRAPQKCAEASAKRRRDLAEDAKSRAGKNPIDPKWLSHCIGQVLDDNCIVFDETIAQNQLHDYLDISQPGAYFHNPASSGGWAQGAAFGAKLAAPDKDVIAVSGDGFYMFGTPIHALWAANALQGAVHGGGLPEPQLFDRHAAHQQRLRQGQLRRQGGLRRRLFRPADRLRQGGGGGRRLRRERHRSGAGRAGAAARARAHPQRPAGGDLGVAGAAAAEGLTPGRWSHWVKPPRRSTGFAMGTLQTRICKLLGIEYPIALGGMGGGHTAAPLVAAVSEAGGFGTLGCFGFTAAQIHEAAAAIRGRTTRPFALNFLLFAIQDDCFAAALREKPAAIAFAWPRRDQDLKHYIDRAHEAGSKVTFMAGAVPEAECAAAAGADVIIAQGTEGGGHVSWMATMVLTPMIVDVVDPIPVLAAGGIADGRGLAAALALGADGVLLGTRFLASDELPHHENFKQAIVQSNGHDTVLTEVPDVAMNWIWPGAMSRVRRNRFVDRWAAREWLLRERQAEVQAQIHAAYKNGDVDEAPLFFGQDAGLIKSVLPAGDIVRRMVREAETVLSVRLPALIK